MLIQNWKVLETKETGNGRKLCKVMVRKDTEDMIYEDILVKAQDGTFSAYAFAGATPPTCISYNGNMIPHNEEIVKEKETFMSKLGVVPLNLLLESTKNERGGNVEIAIGTLISPDRKYNTEFVRLMVKEKMKQIKEEL